MEEARFRTLTPFVVSELIDDELVIMSLRSGNYYSTRLIGAAVWICIENGLSRAEIQDALCSSYRDVPDSIDTDLAAFLEHLTQEGLIEPEPRGGDTKPESMLGELPKLPSTGESFQLPVLEIHTDMQDMLLLDPIHDVDEAGWPTPKS